MRLIYPVAALVGILALSACSTDRNAHHTKKHNLDAQNYSLTYEQVREAAQDGDADAQYALGYMYYYGQNVTRNSNQARFWIRKAAAQNHQQATKALKMMGSADNNVASADSAQTAPAHNLTSGQNTWQEVRRPRDAAADSEQLGRQGRGAVAQSEQLGRPGRGAADQSAQNEPSEGAQIANAGSPRQYRQSFKLNNGGRGAQLSNAADTEDNANNPSAAKHAKQQAARNGAGHKSTVAETDEATVKKPHLTAKERRLAKRNNALHGKDLAKGSSRANHNKYATSKLHPDAQAATLAENESTEAASTATAASDETSAQPPAANQAKSKGLNAKASSNRPSAGAADETDSLANADADEAPSAANTANTSEVESSSAAKQTTQKAAQLSKGAKVALNQAGSSKAQKATQAHNAKPSQAAETNAHNKFALSGSNKPSHDEHNIMSQPSTHYTLQLIGGSSKASIQQVVDRNHLQQKAKIYHTNLNGKDFYVLIYGSYPTQAAAAAEISRLPGSLQQLKPWVKPYSAVKAGIKAAALEGSSKRTR
jgi:DamX protein